MVELHSHVQEAVVLNGLLADRMSQRSRTLDLIQPFLSATCNVSKKNVYNIENHIHSATAATTNLLQLTLAYFSLAYFSLPQLTLVYFNLLHLILAYFSLLWLTLALFVVL